jgi:hypothetical protein
MDRRKLRMAVLVCGVVVIMITGRTDAAWTWRVLDDLPGWPSGIDGDNIVGNYSDSNGQHGFLYNGTGWRSLDYPGATSTSIYGISGNNIVGTHLDSRQRAFLYDGTDWVSLSYPGSSWTFTASGVCGGKVVGNYFVDHPPYPGPGYSMHAAYVYDNGTWTTMSPLWGTSVPYPRAISGDTIIGSYYKGLHVEGSVSYTAEHGFVYDGNTCTALDYPGSAQTVLYGISAGTLVGSYEDSGHNWHGFLYDGSSWTAVDYPGGSRTNLYAIDGNRIVGSYWDGTGTRHSFLLTVPEPATWVLVALGGVWASRRRAARSCRTASLQP